MKHSFHIPVMGIAYTIDTPLKVAHLGIGSVGSIIEDSLLEQLRKFYCKVENRLFQPITNKEEDARAKRVTAFLNMLAEISQEKFKELKDNCNLSEANKYLGLQANEQEIRAKINSQSKSDIESNKNLIDYVKENASAGSIDVNIMTKVDKVNYQKGKALPKEYNDAHASLRGFALSKLNSSLVLSAGLNPSLVSYMTTFDDFFPDGEGNIKKKIILKVSDYRPAIIQANFFAKKGLWISEFRVESGLNCGGHAFATDGFLLGPILEEFKKNRNQLIESMKVLFEEVLKEKGAPIPYGNPTAGITAQGGVGTAEEHSFLLDYYGLDAVGWGSPFLLVPEVSCLDKDSRLTLRKAKEADLYLSDISPLGVPMNNMRGNSMGEVKAKRILKDRPGSPCIKKHLEFNTEFTEKAFCTASRKYQDLKIKELESKNLNEAAYQKEYDIITDKECICTGLGTSFLLENESESYGMDTKSVGNGVSLCPGPNMVYFDRDLSLAEMVGHIYGKIKVISRTDRPHFFVKEMQLYLDYLMGLTVEWKENQENKLKRQIDRFAENLNLGIAYYHQLFNESLKNNIINQKLITDFDEGKLKLAALLATTEKIASA